MAFELAPLPFAENALEPHISARTVSFHYGKHHKGYVETLNTLTAGTPFADMQLENLIRATADRKKHARVFNTAAQVWNHTFFWRSLQPAGAREPGGDLARRLRADIGGPDDVVKAFEVAANEQFGSGWLWLVAKDATLGVIHTGNAELPRHPGQIPLLTIDVWEHAYYLDFQNRRPAFVTSIVRELFNWDFAAANLAAGVSKL